MHRVQSPLSAVSQFVHHHLIWFLLGSYAVAAIAPAPGLWIKNVSFGNAGLLGQQVQLSLPLVLLSCLLLNAGLGVDLAHVGGMLRGWRVLAFGAAANLIVPIAFIFGVTQIMRLWHNPDEVQNILVGLALVASMPIAGSSAAWSQNANGSLVLSLGLVLATTLLSPLTTPMALHSVGLMTSGDPELFTTPCSLACLALHTGEEGARLDAGAVRGQTAPLPPRATRLVGGVTARG